LARIVDNAVARDVAFEMKWPSTAQTPADARAQFSANANSAQSPRHDEQDVRGDVHQPTSPEMGDVWR